MSWDSSDGFINDPGENAARFRFPPTRERASVQTPPRGDTTGRHMQRGERGEEKERAK